MRARAEIEFLDRLRVLGAGVELATLQIDGEMVEVPGRDGDGFAMLQPEHGHILGGRRRYRADRAGEAGGEAGGESAADDPAAKPAI
jgi:hypothetical protein